VNAIAVGKNGAIFSGSRDCTIRVWSGKDGTHVRTLQGHTRGVVSLAVGLDGLVYSGSIDWTIRAWCPDDGSHVRTLTGHTDTVWTLVVGPGGNVFSGSDDAIIMWSAWNGARFRALKNCEGRTLAFGHNGVLYSGQAPARVLIWP